MLIGRAVQFQTPVAAAPTGYVQPRAYFDGNTTLTQLESHAVPSTGTGGRAATLSVWLRRDTTASPHLIMSQTARFRVDLSSGFPRVRLADTAGTSLMARTATAAVPVDGNFHHLLMAWNLSTPVCRVYLDGVDVSPTTGVMTQFGNPMMADGNWSVSTTPRFVGCIGDFYFAQSYLDISVAANRERFRDASGNPVDPDTVTLPTPYFFLRGSGEGMASGGVPGSGTFTPSTGGLSVC